MQPVPAVICKRLLEKAVGVVMASDFASGQSDRAISSKLHTIARNAAASTLGASVTGLVVTPLDVVKVRMQAHVCPVGGVLPCEDPAHVAGVRDALQKIVRADGIRGLWRGLNATLALAVPTTGLYFTMYEAFMSQAARSPSLSDGMSAVVSGGAARIVTATAASPIELARIRLQAGSQGSMSSIIHRIYREDGVRALWRGLGPTLARDAPFSAIYWGCYEFLKDPKRSPMPPQLLSHERGLTGYLCAGVGAGSLAAFVTLPADVIKTRRQAAEQAAVGPTSLLRIARTIVAEEGVRGLFRGVGPRVIKVAPACAIMMGSYELFKTLFS